MVSRMTVPELLSSKIKATKLRGKPIDIFMNAEVFMQAMKEAVDGEYPEEKGGVYKIFFGNEDSDVLEFTIETNEDGKSVVVVSKFSNEYVRYAGVPAKYKDVVLIETIPEKKVSRAKTTQPAVNPIVAEPAANTEKQTPSAQDVLSRMSDEEIANFLASRQANSQNKPDETDVADSNGLDSIIVLEAEAEEQSEVNGNKVEVKEQSYIDDSAGSYEKSHNDGYDAFEIVDDMAGKHKEHLEEGGPRYPKYTSK